MKGRTTDILVPEDFARNAGTENDGRSKLLIPAERDYRRSSSGSSETDPATQSNFLYFELVNAHFVMTNLKL